MSALPPSVSAQVQRCAQDISARLAQLAKDPPDLASYLRVHADCIFQALQPKGLCYEMISGNGFQRVLCVNIEHLRYKDVPEQEHSFQKVLRTVAEKNAPVLLEANAVPAEALHGMKTEDTPAPDQLPVFNRTEYQQLFVPIQLSRKVVGVLQVWFTPADAVTTQTRLALLAMICNEVELYLKTRRISDISQEISRLNTYAKFLEEIAGDMDLDAVSWNVVNYAREAVGCERVCLFTANNYGEMAFRKDIRLTDSTFDLQACSGLKRPHARSEQAEILKAHARELLLLALPQATPALPNGSEPANGSAPPLEGANGSAGAVVRKENDPPALPGTDRPQIRLVLTNRDPSKESTRPEPVNRYFEVVPMNWCTVLPLFDRANRVCGILLFEGVRQEENLQSSFLQMRDLAVSGGRALGTTLYWHQRRSLRAAQGWMKLRERYTNTPPKRIFTKFVLPILVIAGLLALPVPFNIKGQAGIRPVNHLALPALISGRILEISAVEGQPVQAGDALCVIDSQDLELELRQARQEYERAMAEADLALSMGNETQMQIARLNAQKAVALAEKVRRDISHSIIRAPFDGVVVGPQNLAQRRGEVVRVGETIVEVADPRHWEVKVRLREQDISYLENHLEANGPISGRLRLAANPTETHPIEISQLSQFTYGLDPANGEYTFAVLIPFDLAEAPSDFLKVGFGGRVSFGTGYEPLAYLLFRDFAHFIRIRWL